MPYKKTWIGPHMVFVCPNCTQEYRVVLHDGNLPCPHDDNKTRGDCGKCQSEAMMEGRPIPAATPPPPPGPPPPPSTYFGRQEFVAGSQPDMRDDPHFNEREPFIPPQFNPNGEGEN